MGLKSCEKGKLAIELCKIMKWKGRAWNIWNQSLRKKDLEQLIAKLKSLGDE